MASINNLLPLIGGHVEGCPITTKLAQIRWALWDFTTRSYFLRESIRVDVLADVDSYVVASTKPGTEVFGIEAVQFEEQPIDPTGPKETVSPQAAESYRDIGPPTGYWYESPNLLVLRPAPIQDKTEAASVTLLLKHTIDTTVIDDALDREYRHAISYGALFRLMLMPKKPWSDIQQAEIYRQMYERDLANAASKASRQFRRRNFRVRSWA